MTELRLLETIHPTRDGMKELVGLFGIDAIKEPRPANCSNFEFHCFTVVPEIFRQLGTDLSSEKRESSEAVKM